MRPKLVRLEDWSFLIFPAVIVGLIAYALIWNVVSPNGEAIEPAGWAIAGLVIAMTLGIVVAFYWQRWQWIRDYAYTVMGVSYFYTKGAKPYLVVDVEHDIQAMLSKWEAYYKTGGDHGKHIVGAQCFFRPEEAWMHTAPGWWTRKVAGLSGWNWAIVGQGSKSIYQTAHAHELAHIYLTRARNAYVPEDEAHKVFSEAGIS